MSSNIGIIILAAGSSSRMTAIKQLLPWGDKSMLEQTIWESKKTKADNIALVLGAHKEQILTQIDADDLLIIENKDWAAGMGLSLAKGLRSMLKHSEPDGVLILLADQPLIDANYLNTLIQTFNSGSKSIVGTQYSSEKIGVPAIFAQTYFEQLCKLDNDKGAGSIIKANKADTTGLEPEGEEADIDTEDDYNKLLSQFGS